MHAEVYLGEVVTGFRPLYVHSVHMMLTIISLCEDLSLFVYRAKQMPGILETTKIGGLFNFARNRNCGDKTKLGAPFNCMLKLWIRRLVD